MKTNVLQTNVQKHMAAFVMVATMFFGIGMTLTVPQTASAQQNSAIENLDRDGLITLIQELLQQILTQTPASAGGGTVAGPATSNDDSTEVAVGSTIQTSDNVRVRSAAGVFGGALTVRPAGSKGVVERGPVERDGYRWWLVRYDNGQAGWSADNWLRAQAKAGTDAPQGLTPTEDFFDEQVEEAEYSDKLVLQLRAAARDGSFTRYAANDIEVPYGGKVRVAWKTEDMRECRLYDQFGAISKELSGKNVDPRKPSPGRTKTITLECESTRGDTVSTSLNITHLKEGASAAEFDLGDVESFTAVTKTLLGSAYSTTYYKLALVDGRVFEFTQGGGLPAPDAPTLEEIIEKLGYSGAYDTLMARLVKVDSTDDKKEVNRTLCYSGDIRYTEGEKITALVDEDGTVTSIIDAEYVCRLGEWKIEGSAPKQTEDVDKNSGGKANTDSKAVPSAGGGQVQGVSVTALELYQELLARFTQ